VIPILVAWAFWPRALAVLVGSIVTGIFVAISMIRAARHGIMQEIYRRRPLGGKGSEATQGAVTGDTVGDRIKALPGPAINAVIKIITSSLLLLISVM